MSKVIVAAVAVTFGVLAVGCVVADKLFPRIPAVERFIHSLYLGEENK